MSNLSKKRINNECEDEDSEHELFYYANDRIKLMKEVLKLLKPKKMKSMAPKCLQDLDIEELNAMLLEELLGISKKRLKKIFEGQNNDDESSSESDEDIDIISLDDITDDDDIGIVDIGDNDSGRNVTNKRHKHKKHRPKRIKAEMEIKQEKDTSSSGTVKKITIERKKNSDEGENEKLLSVLELLELQARARAIKSQLLIEAENKQKAALEKEQATTEKNKETDNSSNESEDDAIIIDIPKEEEIIIPSSDSEPDEIKQIDDTNIIDLDKEDVQTRQGPPKFRIIRNRVIKPSLNLDSLTITVSNEKAKIDKTANKEQEDRKSPANEMVKEESLANVSEFIGPSHGPIEMIHLDTLDVDLRDIILPEKVTAINKETSGDYINEQISSVVTRKIEIGIDSNKCANSNDICETEDGEINDDKEDSDNDDVLQLDTVIDD